MSRVVARKALGLTLIVAACAWFAWSYFGSDVVAQKKQDEVRSAIVTSLAGTPPAPARLDLGGAEKDAVPGVGLVSIPAIGLRQIPVAEGMEDRVIDSGLVGHSGALPGEGGNVSLAAHVVGHGAVFSRLDELRKGDAITVQTAAGRFKYRVTQGPIEVDKSDSRPLALTSTEQITLLTCASSVRATDERVWVVAEPIKEMPDE